MFNSIQLQIDYSYKKNSRIADNNLNNLTFYFFSLNFF